MDPSPRTEDTQAPPPAGEEKRNRRQELRRAFARAFDFQERTRLALWLWRLFDLVLISYAASGPLMRFAFEWSLQFRWLGFFYRRQPIAYDRFWTLLVPHSLVSILILGRGVFVRYNVRDLVAWQQHRRGRPPVAPRSHLVEFFRIFGLTVSFVGLIFTMREGYNPETVGFLSAWLDPSEGETLRLIDPHSYGIFPDNPYIGGSTPLAPENSPQDWFIYYSNRGLGPDNQPEWSVVDDIYHARAEVLWHRGGLGVPWIERDSLTIIKNIYYSEYDPTDLLEPRPMQELRGQRLMLISYDACLASLHPRHYRRLQEVARQWGARPILFRVHPGWTKGGCVRSPGLIPAQVAEFEARFDETVALDLLPGLSPVEGGGYVIVDPAPPPLARIPLRPGIFIEQAMLILEQGQASYGDVRQCERVRRLGWD